MVKEKDAAAAYYPGLHWVGKDGHAWCNKGGKKVRDPHIKPLPLEVYRGKMWHVKDGVIRETKRKKR